MGGMRRFGLGRGRNRPKYSDIVGLTVDVSLRVSIPRLLKQNTAELKPCCTFSVRQPSEVSNPRKTFGQHAVGTGEGILRRRESSCASCCDSHNPSNGIEPPIR